MVTIKEVAAALNMSTTTVSNVIHGKTKEVSPETVSVVQAYLDKVGYVPNIRRLGNYSSQSTFQVRLSLTETGLNLTAEDMDFSYKGAENIACEYQGEPMEIGFNSRFLREMIENLDADTIQMSFSKPQRAALITPMTQHDENEDVLMLIMPVMLNY